MTLTKLNVCNETGCERPTRSRGRCNRHYEAHRRRMLAYGRWDSARVPAAPVRAHYEALLAAGMSRNQISRVSGVKPDQLDNLLRPRKDRGGYPARIVFRRTADRVLAVEPPDRAQVWRTAADGQRVDPTGTARRLQALVAIGHSQRSLAARLGVLESNMPPIVGGTRLATAGMARKVAALFEELQLTPGDSVRARSMASRRGWMSPLAWDEDTIDDPAAAPMVDAECDTDVDDIAVERGVAWMAERVPRGSQPNRYQKWKLSRPPMTRAERIEVAHRCVGEYPRSIVVDALNLRATDLGQVAA
ncbi:hypothetical protein K3888_11240 [Dietzia aurantiaca]|uniref:hypothetical protein n=1 Tax=Dietzia aurantiaca TaxID=983873 RepID=UPI001E5DDC3B|nr:hypothetical protein [Dietzia aurantiaca]MCD2263272.1 hypothetical protein [Dietzia aurantiaca]